MFKHSVRVPRLYKIAAKIAKAVNEGIGSIKYLVYEYQKRHPNIKAIYALVTTLFQRSDEIECLLKRSQFFVKEPRADPWLSKILIVELLWGTKRLPGGSIPEITVKGYEQVFRAHVSDISLVPKPVHDSKAGNKPRYVRINTLSTSLNEAVEGFENEGWNLCKFFDRTDYTGFLNKITSLAEDEFLIDIHVPDLLIFPPKTRFYKHFAYKNGSIILQDKASCLPVHILNPPPGSIVLDMCAAPGMKTTQLAAVMNNQGTVYAVERDPKRFETLNKIVESSRASCVKTENKDVLTCTAGDFPGVQYIIVDPSCSGSGITDRLEFEQEKSNNRMEKLAGFQIKILRSALTRYPNAKRVVYSTCSIFAEENEDVVRQVLETNMNFKLVPAKQFVNDTWQNFGSSDYGDIGKYCLYAKPNEDFTNGFFVAVFERLGEGEKNQFFNTKIYNYKKHVQSQENRKRKRKQEYEKQDHKETAFRQENNSNNSVNTNVTKGEMDIVNVDTSLKKKKKKIKESLAKNDESKVAEFDKIDTEKNKDECVSDEDMGIIKSIKKKTKRKHTKSVEDISSGTGKLYKKEKRQQIQFEFKKSDECYVDIIKRKKKKRKKKTPEEYAGAIIENNDVIEETYNHELSTTAQNAENDKVNKKKNKDIYEQETLLNEDEGTAAVDKKNKKSKHVTVDKYIPYEIEELSERKNSNWSQIDIKESNQYYIETVKYTKKKRKKEIPKEYTVADVENNDVEKTYNHEFSISAELTSKKKKKTKELQNKCIELATEITLKKKKSKSQESQEYSWGEETTNNEVYVRGSADTIKKKKKSSKQLDLGLPNRDSNKN